MSRIIHVIIIHCSGHHISNILNDENVNNKILSPTGMVQLENLGRRLNSKYANEKLNNIVVYTYDTPRALCSALSVLRGLYPTIDKRLIRGDKSYKRPKNFSECIVRINKAPDESVNNNFHNLVVNKNSSKYTIHVNLAKKLYYMTDDIRLYKVFTTQSLEIDDYKLLYNLAKKWLLAKGDGVTFLPNDREIKLTEGEMRELSDIYSMFIQYKYFTGEYNPVDTNYQIRKELCELVKHKKGGYTIISVHKKHIMMLAKSLGVIIPPPNFGGYWLIEVYDDNTLNLYYNTDPIIPFGQLKKIYNKYSNSYRTIDNTEDKSWTVDEFLYRFHYL